MPDMINLCYISSDFGEFEENNEGGENMKRHSIRIILTMLLVVLLALSVFPTANASESTAVRGGINIVKTDVLGNGLQNCTYQIAREATMEELRDSAITKRLLKTADETLTVVYESFWDSREMAGGKVMEAVTSEDGSAAMYGLPYGTYYLVESKAPDGYNKMTAPIRVTINKYSHLTSADDIRDDDGIAIDNTVHIVTIRYSRQNSRKTETSWLPILSIGFVVSFGAVLHLDRIRRKCVQ